MNINDVWFTVSAGEITANERGAPKYKPEFTSTPQRITFSVEDKTQINTTERALLHHLLDDAISEINNGLKAKMQ